MATIKLFDTIALALDISARGLKRGEVGTAVEVLQPDVFEVEFCDDNGETYQSLVLKSEQLIVLHNQGKDLKIIA